MTIAVIAGTGLSDPASDRKMRVSTTPFGEAFLSEVSFGGSRTLMLARHGSELNIPPHLINYRANMWALRDAGVDTVIATAAVGSLVPDLAPGSLAVVKDFLDLTRQRPSTFQDVPGESVRHLDLSVAYCPEVRDALCEAAGHDKFPEVVYACTEGPRYETPAEVRMLRRLGADVVGMTGVPEVVLARELGMCYGTLAIVTNYAAGISPTPLSHNDVASVAREHRQVVLEIIGRAVGLLVGRRGCAGCATDG
ncbi:MAG: MTAP family purine nucleoside phosphorylase [Armatimonadetes bacterium]|nr:MTAP family purine nucleoside phosphorylase [Armatimonadota bacterium]